MLLESCKFGWQTDAFHRYTGHLAHAVQTIEMAVANRLIRHFINNPYFLYYLYRNIKVQRNDGYDGKKPVNLICFHKTFHRNGIRVGVSVAWNYFYDTGLHASQDIIAKDYALI